MSLRSFLALEADRSGIRLGLGDSKAMFRTEYCLPPLSFLLSVLCVPPAASSIHFGLIVAGICLRAELHSVHVGQTVPCNGDVIICMSAVSLVVQGKAYVPTYVDMQATCLYYERRPAHVLPT